MAGGASAAIVAKGARGYRISLFEAVGALPHLGFTRMRMGATLRGLASVQNPFGIGSLAGRAASTFSLS